MVTVDTVTDTHIDTDMDTGEERDPLMPNQRQKLHHGTDMVDTTVDTTDTHTDTDMDTTEESDLPMLKLSHGTDMDTPDTHTLMVDTTDTHTLMEVTTISARDLLMLNQKLKLNHGTATVDTTATHTDMDMDTDTGVKSFLQCYQEHIIPQLKYLPFAFGKSKYFLKIV